MSFDKKINPPPGNALFILNLLCLPSSTLVSLSLVTKGIEGRHVFKTKSAEGPGARTLSLSSLGRLLHWTTNGLDVRVVQLRRLLVPRR